MDDRIQAIIDNINSDIELATDLKPCDLDMIDYATIHAKIDVLSILTDKKYTIRGYKVVEV